MNIKTYQREEVLPLLPAMHEICVMQLAAFPYLYAPRKDQLVNPSDTIYANEQNARVLVAHKEHKIEGIVTGIPLNSFYLTAHYFSPDLIEKFKEKGFDPDVIWYVGYFLMSSAHRKDTDLVLSLYEKTISFAKKQGKTHISYVDVIREKTHPLKPMTVLHPEPWGDIIDGFKSAGVTVEAAWPHRQPDYSVKEEKVTILFYIKEL